MVTRYKIERPEKSASCIVRLGCNPAGRHDIATPTVAAARPKKKITKPGVRSSASIRKAPVYSHIQLGAKKSMARIVPNFSASATIFLTTSAKFEIPNCKNVVKYAPTKPR